MVGRVANVRRHGGRWYEPSLGEREVAAFHDLTMDAITGEPLSFEKYKGQACLVVNLASQ